MRHYQYLAKNSSFVCIDKNPKMKYSTLRISGFVLVATLLLFAGCTPKPTKKMAKKTTKQWDNTIPGSFSQQVSMKLDSSKVDSFFAHYPDLKTYAPQVKNLLPGKAICLCLV